MEEMKPVVTEKEEIQLGGNSSSLYSLNFLHCQYSNEKNKTNNFQPKYTIKSVKLPHETLREGLKLPIQLKQANERLMTKTLLK